VFTLLTIILFLLLITYYDPGAISTQWKTNSEWIEKELPTKKGDIHKTLEWCKDTFGATVLNINHGMIPFLLPMGDAKNGTLRLQYGPVNHNQINPNTALEIANNLAGNPMDFYSGHLGVMDKDFELVFYQSNEVRLI
jgi:hypothetical protein